MLRKTSRNDITTSIIHILKLFNIYIYIYMKELVFFIGNKKVLALKVFKTRQNKYTQSIQTKPKKNSFVRKKKEKKKQNISLTWQITNLQNQSKMCDPLYTP